jgi:hypothetical protein
MRRVTRKVYGKVWHNNCFAKLFKKIMKFYLRSIVDMRIINKLHIFIFFDYLEQHTYLFESFLQYSHS